jgi:hypothetical protein
MRSQYLDRLCLLAWLGVVLIACGLETAPSTDPLATRTGLGNTATIYGEVYEPAAPSTPWAERVPVAGAVIELGHWSASIAEFRDTLARAVAASPDDPRFEIVSRTITDRNGRYRLAAVPKESILALRARPPSGRPYRVTYLASLFSLQRVDSTRFALTFEPRP